MISNNRASLDPPAKYSLTPDGKVKWQEVRDLEAGWTLIKEDAKKNLTSTSISKRRGIPQPVVREVMTRWQGVKGFPTSKDIVDMRVTGHTVQQIARHYQITIDDVKAMLNAELAQMESPTEQYAVEMYRMERYFKAIEDKIQTGDIRAVVVGIRLSEHKMAVLQSQLEAASNIADAAHLLTNVIQEMEDEAPTPQLTHEPMNLIESIELEESVPSMQSDLT